MRRFNKAALTKNILTDMARLARRLAGILLICSTSFLLRTMIPFFIGSLACFILTYMLLNGLTASGNLEFAKRFVEDTAAHPLSLLPLYAQWFVDVFDNGIHSKTKYVFAQFIPALPLVYAAYSMVFTFFRPPVALQRENYGAGRKARFEFIGEVLHHWKQRKRGFSDEEFYAKKEDPYELPPDPFEKEFFDEDTEEDVSAALKTLFISDGVKIFGKETFYEEWAEKTRMCVILCTPKEANGFFIQAFYQHRLRNRDCANLRGYYRDMTDADAAEEIKKIQAGTFNTAKYDKITFWERPPLSWKKAKVMFCMLPDFDEMNGK